MPQGPLPSEGAIAPPHPRPFSQWEKGAIQIHPTPSKPVLQSVAMTRDWILRVLEDLAIWYWPIFLWDCARVRRVLDGMFDDGAGMISFGVTPTGRIIIVDNFAQARPDPGDWTAYAPHAPWLARSPEAIAERLAALDIRPLNETPATPWRDPCGTIAAPAFLDSG